MKRKLSLIFAFLMVLNVCVQPAYAIGAKAAGASLFLPTTGQAMNGQIGATKTKVMAGLEVGLVTGTAILAGVVGGPVVWATVGPLIANHLWSSADAYKGAQNKVANEAQMQAQMQEAQKVLEDSRQRRYSREQQAQSDIRTRIQQAAIQANY